ncbi:Sec7 domain-containing protein [Ceratocystis lukuohia]|uniref:Sec7 domain-containing protein n=1 Tax=Ceratocystis lukuohia TaxID=2019550 RepID=A0ABR4MBL9_9PEZI
MSLGTLPTHSYEDSQSGLSSQLPSSRMQYRNHPVSVAVDPVSLVISECISITSEIRKRAPLQNSSVSAILGGSPNPVHLVPPSPRDAAFSSTSASRVDDDVASGNRWGLRATNAKSTQDHPLMSSFGRLRHELSGTKDICSFDALSLLKPFLQIMQTKGTAAPITILALGALRKFLAYGFIGTHSPRFPLAMQSLSSALTHCQFNDSGQMEVVLLMILNLMEDMMSGPGGHILSDDSVCKMMQRGLVICSSPRFSPVLRQTAEATLIRMCQIIFQDLKFLESESQLQSVSLDDDPNLDVTLMGPPLPIASEKPQDDPLNGQKEDLVVNEDLVDDNTIKTSTPDTPLLSESQEDGDTSHKAVRNSTSSSRQDEDEEMEMEPLDLRPYSLASVKEVLRVLVSFLDPNDLQYTATMRIMALRIIHVALEVAGSSLARHPSLAAIVSDSLCCHLFQLVRSDNMDLLQESLAVAGTLLETCRDILKLQQEFFISFLITSLFTPADVPRELNIDPSLYDGIPKTLKLVKPAPAAPTTKVASGRSTPVAGKDRSKSSFELAARKPDARQAMVECVGVLSRMPTFMIELFVNYDCDEDRADLCEDLVGLLSRNALPDSATWSTTSVPPLCLDALLRFVQFLAERLDDEPKTDGLPDAESLKKRRQRKLVISKGAAIFNEKPKDGLAYLEAQGIIEDASNPVSVASFLQSTTKINKAVLGDFISKRGNESILDAFLNAFDFSGKTLDEALRMMLETFRLPGEAPLIERIVSLFSEKYFESYTDNDIAHKDSVFILTYAVIILNTDQHNPNLKHQKRMTFEDFSRNLRGQNNGEDFLPEFLQRIFDSIRSNEIILPDEHDNQHAFNYAWRELLSKAGSESELLVCDTNIYDSELFATTWKPIVSTLAYVFMSATDDAVFARVVTGFHECARIAAKHGNTEALDQIVYCLCQMSTLAEKLSHNTALNTEVQVGDSSVMVSELAVKLGRDFRAQLASLVLFRVVNGNEALVQRGWSYIIQIWLNLFINSLIPSFATLSNVDKLTFPEIPLQTPSQVIDRATKVNDSGFFSAFTSYISSYAADDPPEPSDEELESTLCTIDCVKQCNMQDIFTNIQNMDPNALAKFIDMLLRHLPEGSPAVINVMADQPPASPVNGQNPTSSEPTYDPSILYILELCTIFVLKDDETVGILGRPVADSLFSILRDAKSNHSIVVSRCALHLFELLRASYQNGFINVPVLLHTIANFPKDVMAKCSNLLLKGLRGCIQEPSPLRSEIMTSPDFWAILRLLSGRPDCSSIVFEILDAGTTGDPPSIISDNYEAAIKLLNDFATASRLSTSPRPDIKQRPSSQRSKKTCEADEVVSRGMRAITLIYNMTGRIPHLMKQSHLESNEAWSAYWLPVFKSLTSQCTNPCRDVRQLAFTSLHRTLLSPDLTDTNHKEWTAIFSEVLFPLIHRLLKPEVFSSDREGMGEMRVQTASLLCKVFLQYLVILSSWDGMFDLWVKIIDIMDRLLNSGQGDVLEEAVRENLKNVVLFMSSIDYLVPPSKDNSKAELWHETWKRIDRFLPDLKIDLALEVDHEGSASSEKEKQDAIEDVVTEGTA